MADSVVFDKYDEDELNQIVLDIIEAVDYDIYKEVDLALQEDGYDPTVDEIIRIILEKFA